MQTLAKVSIKICGIPCIAAVTYYDISEDDGGIPCGNVDWIICDKNGRKADWLEKKCTPEINDTIRQCIYEHMEVNHA